jgi:DNA-binding SARP family transcriptional activator
LKEADRRRRRKYGSAVKFRVLGPVEVVEDDRLVPLGGRKQRVVLARLLLRANQTVATATLIDDVWGEDPPEAVRNSLQSYISHLRKALGNGRIRSGSGGYVLRAEPDEIDARQFESLVDQGRTEAMTDAVAAAATFGRALALWRGPAFGDLSDELSLLGEIARLEDLRLSATEHKLAAEIAAGRHSAVVGELEALTSRHQLRERLWGQLMLALYRSGRQGEALAA